MAAGGPQRPHRAAAARAVFHHDLQLARSQFAADREIRQADDALPAHRQGYPHLDAVADQPAIFQAGPSRDTGNASRRGAAGRPRAWACHAGANSRALRPAPAGTAPAAGASGRNRPCRRCGPRRRSLRRSHPPSGP
ncbi:hypothetical protein G6F59_017885 [Rhizopus arrhizus]|nr:hypothetical protein G6F59_017885 [Rhizopus arrhizus]